MRSELRAKVSRHYSGPAHLAFTLTTSIGVTVALLSRVRNLDSDELFAVPAFFVVCCFLEYLEHRYLLHQRTWLGAAAYRIHTVEHHRFFTDEYFTPDNRRDWAFVLFPPALVLGYMLLVVPLFGAAAYYLFSPNIGYLVGATAALFFFLYEVIHFASHVGERVPWLWRIFRRLGEHHRIHHRPDLMKSFNFNVVCPLFDWLFGTLEK
jgi:hypothetical protein